MGTNSPKTVTIYGRLSFPTWTAQEAFVRNQKGKYPTADVASTKPDFTLLVGPAQWDRFYKHVVEQFLPYCEEQHKKGDKKDALSPAEVKVLMDGLLDLPNQMYNTPAKVISEATATLAPEAVAGIKCVGPTGGDIALKAVVTDESDMNVPDPDLLLSPENPKVLPITQTKFQMYPGAWVGATLNLYAFHIGKQPGFSAGVSAAVYKMDGGERFGGSIEVDEDAIFLD